MSSLSSAGHISYPGPKTITLSDSGRGLAAEIEQPRTERELHARILSMIGGVKANMLSILIGNYPNPVEKQALAEALDYTNVASTGFAKALSTLSGLGLIEYPTSGFVRARDALFFQGNCQKPGGKR